MNPVQVQSSSPLSRPDRSFQALNACFFLFGFVFASWASRIPAIRDFALLTTATLTIALLVRGVGAVSVFPVAAAFITKLGAKKSALIAGLALSWSLPLLAVFPHWIGLTLMLFLVGTVTSFYDISINTLGSDYEHRTGTSRMSFFHAWFCVGNFAGAIGGGLAAGQDLSPFHHFLLISLLATGILMWAIRHIPFAGRPVEQHTSRFQLPDKALFMLGIIGFAAALTESSINSWTTLYYTDYLGTTEALAPLGFGAFSVMMLLSRGLGDLLKDRFGAGRVLAFGGVMVSGGLMMTWLTTSLYIATTGFALAGWGVAVAFPFLFSAAGKKGPVALTTVATMGYTGSIAAPPLMGYVINHGGMNTGMGFLAVISLLLIFLSLKSTLLRK